ncbi:MAG: hypothetical protein M1136_05760 [Chloroflexi bacterium]|nr:hypothetical protein [Chloroflexota bacterium]MCL5075144.1 hypothetical protein [Chloroflexota bacterium]
MRWYAAPFLLIVLAVVLTPPTLVASQSKGQQPEQQILSLTPSLSSTPAKVYLPHIAKSYQWPFSDDFSNPGGGWPSGDDAVTSVGYVDGEYRILVKQANYVVRAGHSLSTADFRAEVDARAVASTNGTYGLYFGSGDAGFYLYEVYNGQYRLERYNRSAKTWTTLTSGGNTVIRSGNQTNRLKVVRRGTYIELYVNGLQIGSTYDSTLGSGYVGLAAGAFQANFEARFDNFLLVFDATDMTTQAVGPRAETGAGSKLHLIGPEENSAVEALPFRIITVPMDILQPK